MRKSGSNINKNEAAEMRFLMSVTAVTVRRLIRTKNLENCRSRNIIGVSHLKLNYGKKWSEQLKEGNKTVSQKKNTHTHTHTHIQTRLTQF